MLVKVHRYPTLGFSNLFDLRTDMHDMFAGLLNDGSLKTLPIDLAEEENQYRVAVEVPGVKKEDIKVSVQDGSMTIEAERKSAEVAKKWLRNEIPFGKFSRTLQVPREVKVDGISAELTDGVLHLVLPKSEEARTREIAVK